MKLDLSNKRQPVELVLAVTRSLIKEQHGRGVTFRVPAGGKMALNCSRLQVFARERGISIKELMCDILGMYGVDFCMRTFKTPYPQINVILSDKTFERLKTMNKKPVKVLKKDTKAIVQTYLDTMKDVDYATAVACVKGGYPPAPAYIRQALLVALKERKNAS